MYVLKAKKILTQQNQYSKLKKREKYASLTDEKEKKRAKARENYHLRKARAKALATPPIPNRSSCDIGSFLFHGGRVYATKVVFFFF